MRFRPPPQAISASISSSHLIIPTKILHPTTFWCPALLRSLVLHFYIKKAKSRKLRDSGNLGFQLHRLYGRSQLLVAMSVKKIHHKQLIFLPCIIFNVCMLWLWSFHVSPVAPPALRPCLVLSSNSKYSLPRRSWEWEKLYWLLLKIQGDVVTRTSVINRLLATILVNYLQLNVHASYTKQQSCRSP